MKKGQALRNKNNVEKQNAENFLELYEQEWGDMVGAVARQTIRERNGAASM